MLFLLLERGRMIKATVELRDCVPKEPRGSFPGEVKYSFAFWKPSKKKGFKWEQITSRLTDEPVLIAVSKSQLTSWSEAHASKARFIWCGVTKIGEHKVGPQWNVEKIEIPEGVDVIDAM